MTVVSFLESPENLQNAMVYLVEGTMAEMIVPETPYEAFPTPQFFQWSRDGSDLANSDRRTLHYPSITFDPVKREDAGSYSLRAVNYKCGDNVLTPPTYQCGAGGFILGSGDGSISLHVLCKLRVFMCSTAWHFHHILYRTPKLAYSIMK